MYELPRVVTLLNNETKQIALFTKLNIPVQKQYIITHNQALNNEEGKSAEIKVLFKNDEKSDLGMPMPQGKFTVNKNDGTTTEFIGEDLIKHRAKNDMIKLKIGEAFDVKATAKETSRDNFKRGYTGDYEVTLKNTKNQDVTIQYTIENNYVEWEISKENFEYTQESSSTAVFNIPVKKDEEVVLKFRLKVKYR